MTIVNALVGLALLLWGRKVFWLFITGAGFLAGMALATQVFHGPDWVNILFGIGLGLLVALLALFLQHVAIGLAGFLAGGYLVMSVILPLFNLDLGWLPWLGFIVGGIIGIILVNQFLDWALIGLSSLAGASFLTEALNLQALAGIVAFLVLLIFGLSVQVRELRKKK